MSELRFDGQVVVVTGAGGGLGKYVDSTPFYRRADANEESIEPTHSSLVREGQAWLSMISGDHSRVRGILPRYVFQSR